MNNNKKTDEKQDRVIEQLQKNQLALTSGIQDIMTLNRELPQITPEEEGAVGGEEEEEPPIFIEPDAEKFWDDNLYRIIKENNLKTSKELYQLSYAELKEYEKTAKDLRIHMANQLKGNKKNKDVVQLNKDLESSKIYENTVHNIMEAKRHAKTPKREKVLNNQSETHIKFTMVFMGD